MRADDDLLLKVFVKGLLDGTRSYYLPQIRFFDQFSSTPERGKVRWPLCYLSEIMSVLEISGSGVREVIQEIYKISSREIPVFVSMVETGLNWESVVLLCKGKHPLVWSLAQIKSIEFVPMQCQVGRMLADTSFSVKQNIETSIRQ